MEGLFLFLRGCSRSWWGQGQFCCISLLLSALCTMARSLPCDTRSHGKQTGLELAGTTVAWWGTGSNSS